MASGSEDRNRETVKRLFEAIRAGTTDDFDALMVADYVQHNPQGRDGRDSIKAVFAQMGPVDIEIHRLIAEDDLVAVHSHFKTMGAAVVDIYRLNDEGKIVEHWDVFQQVPDTTASGNDMFSQLT